MRSRSSSSGSFATAPTNETQQIFVKLLNNEIIPLDLPPNTAVSTLSQLLSLRLSIPASSFRLQHAGHILPQTSTLPPAANTTIDVTLPILGGGAEQESTTTTTTSSSASTTTTPIAIPTTAPRKKKNRCTHKDCKEAAQRIVGDCSFCNGHFCGKHRMLEDHKCSGLEDCKKESHERNADKLNSERTLVVKGI